MGPDSFPVNAAAGGPQWANAGPAWSACVHLATGQNFSPVDLWYQENLQTQDLSMQSVVLGGTNSSG